MATRLKAKFHCNKVIVDSYGEEPKLTAQYANEHNEEDNQFSEATPSGNIDMIVSNPSAKGFFKPGIEYYVYFEPCPRDRQSDQSGFDKHFAN